MLIGEQFAKAFSPVDSRPYHVIASECIELFPPVTRPGLFNSKSTRHFEAPLDALHNPEVRETNVLAPPRSGKTLICDVWLSTTVIVDPGPFLWVFQDKTAAEDHAAQRALKILRACARARHLMPTDRHKDTTTSIELATGDPIVISGPAISQLQSRGYRYLALDELWLYARGRLAEARARLGDYAKLELDKLLCMSQGGEEGTDWEDQVKSGEFNDWAVQCSSCEEYMFPDLEAEREDGSRWGLKFDHIKDKNGFYLPEECGVTARFECQHCKTVAQDCARTQTAWNLTGRYEVIGPKKRRKKSFHWSCIIDTPWPAVIELWAAALNAEKYGNYSPKIKFMQKQMARFRSERTIHADSKLLFRKVYVPGSEWKEEVERICTIDRQKEGVYWVMVRAWGVVGRKIESRRLAFRKCFSKEEVEAVREEFNVHPRRTFCDSGFEPKGPDGVYAACIKYGWVATKGEGAKDFLHVLGEKGETIKTRRSYAPVSWGDPETGEGMCILIRYSSDAMSDRVQGMIDTCCWVDPTDDGSELEKAYKVQMAAEYKKPRKDKFSEEVELIWVCPSGENHAWDLSKLQVLGATMLDILPDLEAKATPAKGEQEELKEAA